MYVKRHTVEVYVKFTNNYKEKMNYKNVVRTQQTTWKQHVYKYIYT